MKLTRVTARRFKIFGIDDALIAGGASLIGGLLKNDADADRQKEAQAFNAQQAEINRNWQEMMSNTAYQRGMADMKQAGLNPILAYQKGPASSPSGATASTTFTPSVDAVSPAVQSALAARANAAQVSNLVQQNENLKAQFDQTNAATAKLLAETTNTETDTRLKEAVIPRTNEETNKVREEILRQKYENTAKSIDAKQQSTFAGEWARRIGTSAKDALSVVPFVNSTR